MKTLKDATEQEIEQVMTYKVYCIEFGRNREVIYGYFSKMEIADQLLELFDTMNEYGVVTLPNGEQYQSAAWLTKREISNCHVNYEFVVDKCGIHFSSQSVLDRYFTKRLDPKAAFF